MPRLSDTMEEGRIGRWLKREGDSFREGDIIAEIETDKATMEFQAYDDGTVLRIIVDDGETAALGAPIAIVGEAGEKVEDVPAEKAVEPEPTETTAPDANVSPKEAPAQTGNGKAEVLRVSPIARRMADAAGLDLRTLAGKGSGPDGRIVKADVELAIGSEAPETDVPGTAVSPAPGETLASGAVVAGPPAGDEVRELSPMLKGVARRMSESKTTVPHFYVTSEIDMTRALALRKELNEALAESGRRSRSTTSSCAAAQRWLHPQAHRPTSTAGTSTTPTPMSGSPSRSTTASSCPSSARPTRRAFARSPSRPATSPSARGPGSSASPRSRAARSRSRTWGCSESRRSRRSSTRPSRRSSPCRRRSSARSSATAPSRWATSCRSRSRATTARAPEPTARGCSRP